MANEKRLIPLSKRIVCAGDVFNSLMAEKGWSATEASDFMKVFRVVDAVEVVRCKDCEHKYINKHGELCCEIWAHNRDTVVIDYDFCSYGRRKIHV